jgi:hypothetical protein
MTQRPVSSYVWHTNAPGHSHLMRIHRRCQVTTCCFWIHRRWEVCCFWRCRPSFASCVLRLRNTVLLIPPPPRRPLSPGCRDCPSPHHVSGSLCRFHTLCHGSFVLLTLPPVTFLTSCHSSTSFLVTRQLTGASQASGKFKGLFRQDWHVGALWQVCVWWWTEDFPNGYLVWIDNHDV